MSPHQFSVGLDVGGTNMRAAKVSASGEIFRRKSISGSRDPVTALELIKGLIAEMDGSQAVAIGIGVPGRVNGWTGDVISGGFLDLSGTDLRTEIGRTFDGPVKVANDCSMALIGEARRGAARDLDSALMMTIGTGIGGAVMEAGRIVNGRRCAGQFGHLIVKLNGRPCPCGQQGCVETESSGTSLRRHLDEAGYGSDIRFEYVRSLAEAGDKVALDVMQAWAGPLRAAIRTLSAAFDPDAVLLGGGMGQAALRALEFLPDAESWYDVEVRAAALDDDAGVIGAALAAFDLLQGGVSTGPAGKQLVMVNGVPASGKSSVSHALSRHTGWPVLALDTIKNPFLELMEEVDRAFNRVLGRASYKSIFSVIEEAPPGSTFIVDAWFGFQPVEVLREHIAVAGITEVLEIWCHAAPEIVGERYSKRLERRLPGHPGASYVPELIELSRRAEPCGIGPVLNVDTALPVDMETVVAWLDGASANHKGRKTGTV